MIGEIYVHWYRNNTRHCAHHLFCAPCVEHAAAPSRWLNRYWGSADRSRGAAFCGNFAPQSTAKSKTLGVRAPRRKSV